MTQKSPHMTEEASTVETVERLQKFLGFDLWDSHKQEVPPDSSKLMEGLPSVT